ncbi:MAG: T9SS type A sorting domain-containing protein [Bacteroidetes bacterium]|nr:T9SS type A sorting domain-containing protein [Bacteroidota bacterium]
MKKRILYPAFLFLILIVFAVSQSGLAQWSITSGPNTVGISNIYSYNSNLYTSAGRAGVYKSTNGGLNWVSIGLTGKMLACIAIMGSDIFAGSNDNSTPGIYYSSNDGASWTFRSSSSFYCVTKMFVIGNKLYVGTSNAGFVCTSDKGITWTTLGEVYGGPNCMLEFNNKLFVGGEFGKLFISSDNGQTWAYVYVGQSTSAINALAVSGSILYAGTEGESVQMSTNYGLNWVPKNNGLQWQNCYCLHIDGNRMYAGTMNGVYISTDNGNNWSQSYNGFISYSYVYDILTFGNKIICGTATGVYYSTNYGGFWVNSSSGLASMNVYSIRAIGNNLFANSLWNGVHYSSNGGADWKYIGFNQWEIWTLAVSGPYIYAPLYDRVIYRTSDCGQNWEYCSNMIPNGKIKTMATTGDYIYAGTDNGIFRTVNTGTNWTETDNGITNLNIYCLYARDSLVWAGTSGGGLYRSTDYGNHWTLKGNGIPSNLNKYRILTRDSCVVVSVLGGGIYVSTNNGENFVQRNSGIWNYGVTRIESIIFYENNLITCAGGNIYLSTNMGVNWIPKVQGLDTLAGVSDLQISNGYLYASTFYRSVWKRSLADLVGINSISAELPLGFTLYQNYPNPFNPFTSIKFEIPKSSLVKITIFDLSGKEIETLVNQNVQPGVYETQWNASNYSSGIYFCRMQAGDFTQTKKMVLVK